MIESKKLRILKELGKVYPNDLSIGEVVRKAMLLQPTASTYLKVLCVEGKIEVSRKVGRAIFYRTKRKTGLKEE